MIEKLKRKILKKNTKEVFWGFLNGKKNTWQVECVVASHKSVQNSKKCVSHWVKSPHSIVGWKCDQKATTKLL